MESKEFKKAQKYLGLTNAKMAERIGVSVRTIEAWRGGQRNITKPIEKLINLLLLEEIKK